MYTNRTAILWSAPLFGDFLLYLNDAYSGLKWQEHPEAQSLLKIQQPFIVINDPFLSQTKMCIQLRLHLKAQNPAAVHMICSADHLGSSVGF